MKCLDCNYGCGTPHTLLFHDKIEHKDKVIKCACGNQTISGNCLEKISSKLKGIASKGSSSSSSSSSSFSSSSGSNSNSDSNLRSSFTDSDSNSDSISNSNLQSSWGTKGETTLPCPFSNSHIKKKFDITNKICIRCRLMKQITCIG